MSKPEPDRKIVFDAPYGFDEVGVKILVDTLREHGYIRELTDSARLVTLNDALVEKVARAMWGSGWKGDHSQEAWEAEDENVRQVHLASARAALRVAFGEEG